MRADPGYYVVTPHNRPGLGVVDLRYWTVKAPAEAEVVWPELGVGYGVNSRWSTLLLASWIGFGQQARRLSTLNWTNDVLLTQGEVPFARPGTADGSAFGVALGAEQRAAVRDAAL